ncbi:MAG: ACT domain-containing protein, partial [Rubrobacteraceae bacterium]
SCESIVAAVFLDAGYAAARAVVEGAFGKRMEASKKPPRDPKTLLQEWAQGKGRLFTVEILVEALDRMHLLKDVTSIISDAGVSILSARVDTIEDRTALSRFAFKAASLGHVEEIRRKIRSIPDVYDVRRVSRDGTPLNH